MKRLTRSIFIKLIAFITILTCAFFFVIFVYDMRNIDYIESVIQPYYMKSEEFAYQYRRIMNNVIYMLNYYNESYTESYERIYSELGKIKGLYYYVADGTTELKNTAYSDKQFYTSKPSSFLIQGNNLEIKPNNTYIINYFNNNIFYNEDMYNKLSNENFKLYIALSAEYLNPIINDWDSSRDNLIHSLVILGIMLLTSLAAFIYLIITTGKRGSGEEIKLSLFDKLYTDINMSIICFTLAIGIEFFYEIIRYAFDSYFVQIIAASTVALTVAICLVFILSLIRHIKNHSFVKHSFIYSVCYKIYKVVSSVFAGGPMMLKAMVATAAFGSACMLGAVLFPLGLLFIAISMYYVFVYVNNFKQIKYCVKRVKEGELGCKINLKGNSELAGLSRDINSIADGLDKAVSNEVKSERMKSELITNVSHDIKTPLTSIINYVDLLKKEGINSENASKYIDILEQKSQRLKVLTEDLFEAAKASSGDMPVTLEKVDIFSLIQQGLGELEDKIEKSGLHFKINAPDDKIYALADGRLLWRVVENLLSNVFKYALKASRVYIDIAEAEDSNNVLFIIKNISSYELNIQVDELMERFKRADESRSSEGSGLGLAIAKNLMEIQKGSLNLEIDGDLFKATVVMPKLKEEAVIEG